jgi:hypothetical protein
MQNPSNGMLIHGFTERGTTKAPRIKKKFLKIENIESLKIEND